MNEQELKAQVDKATASSFSLIKILARGKHVLMLDIKTLKKF